MMGPNSAIKGTGGNDSSPNVGPNDQTGSESAPSGPVEGLHENHSNMNVPFENGSPWGAGANGNTS